MKQLSTFFNTRKHLFIAINALVFFLIFTLGFINKAEATVTLTAATYTGSISADNVGGTYTSLTNPKLVESTLGEIGLGTIILTAPTGFIFDVGGTAPTVLVTGHNNGTKNINGTNGGGTITVTATTTTLTINITSVSNGGGGIPNTLTWQNVRVKPSAGTPLASGNITKSGTSTFTASGSNYGTLTEVGGVPTTLGINTIASPQTAGLAFSVTITGTDQYGNGANGALTISTATGGSISPTSATLASGTVTTSFTLTQAGSNKTITATYNAVNGTSNTFTVNPGAASKLVFITTAITTTAGVASSSITVQRQDANGNPNTTDADRTITLASNSTGTVTFTPASPLTIATGSSTVSFTYTDTKSGTPTITAASTSPSTITSATQAETVIAAAATQIAINAGNGQSATVGTAVSTAPSVIVRDTYNNPKSGVSVTFAVATGGGSGTVLTATTNASGIATVGSWTLGTTAGSNTMTATSAGLTGSPLTFTATGTAGTATQIAINAGNGQSATVGTAVSTAPSVIVRDTYNNPKSGVSVTFAVATGGGSGTGLSATTNASGIATVGSWTLGTIAGSNTMTATSGSLIGSPVTFTATGTAGAATKGILTTQPSGAVNGMALTTQPVVQLQDANSNNVSTSGVNVVATIASGSGVLSGTTTVATDGSGVATFTDLVITGTIGNYTLTFTPTSLTAATSTSFALTAGTKTSTSAGDWNSITWSPSGAPSVGDDVIIDHAVTLAGNANCHDLTIGTGSLVLSSGASFIPTGGVTGDVSVKRSFLGSDKFQLFILPVSGGIPEAYPTFDGAFLDDYLEPSGAWYRMVDISPVSSDRGYSINYASSTELTFTGPIYTTSQTFGSLAYTPGAPVPPAGWGPGWHLLGNPFTSAVDANASDWSPSNLDTYIYVWDAVANNFKCTPAGVGYATLPGGIIPAMQGFFVHATSGGASLTIPAAARIHSSQAFYKNTKADKDILSLTVEGNGYNDKAIVDFNPEATAGFDSKYDAYKLMGGDAAPQLYSILPNQIATVNSLPSITDNEKVNLGLKVGKETTYTLSVSGQESFDANTPIRLDDLKLGTSQDLRAYPNYSFTAAPGDAENRFRLRFSSALGVDPQTASTFRIFASQGQVHIRQASTEKGTAYVYTAAGQLVGQSSLSPNETLVRVYTPGVYVVRVVTDKTSVSVKVVLSNPQQ